MRFTAADVYIAPGLPQQATRQHWFWRTPSNAGAGVFSSSWLALLSPTPAVSCNDSMGKEIFLRRPPPSFDRDFEGDEHRRSHDIDENWLPHIKDIFSGNVHVMIDMTGDSDSEVCPHLHTTRIITWH